MIAPGTNHSGRRAEKRERLFSLTPHSTCSLWRARNSCRSRLACKEPSNEQRSGIISTYQDLLEKWTEPVGPESVLPFPKDLIREAIFEEVLENPNSDQRNHLEIAYVQLESFIPDEEYRVLSEFKNAFVLAQKMADSGEPGNLLASVRLLGQTKGDRAVRIQEKISRRITERLEQIRAAGMSAEEVGAPASPGKLV